MGVLAWFLQRISGVVLFLGLVVHFYVMHYSGEGQIGYEAVMARLRNPFWITFDVLFLVFVIYHGFNGIWGIVVEYIASSTLRRVCHRILLASSFILLGAGVYIVVS